MNYQYLTSRETHEDSSIGSSSIEFLERSSLVISLDSHTSEGTTLNPSPPKASSYKSRDHKKI